MPLTTNQKGAIAETAITLAAVRQGITVLRPVVEGERYDLVFEIDGRFLRVQCKSARRVRDVVVVRAQTCRRGPSGRLIRSRYVSREIDAVAAYCPDNDTCYAIPIGEVPAGGDIQRRLAPAKNNQRVGLNWASDYEFGAIAQLGERRHGMAEVVGSSPTSSTPPQRPDQC